MRIAEGGWQQSPCRRRWPSARVRSGRLHSGLALLTLGPPAQPLEQALSCCWPANWRGIRCWRPWRLCAIWRAPRRWIWSWIG
ncbi:hypothetical protein [Paracoccus mutanolyticus]|uniref:hypothetical protein n=1 Tax=Paracoccus mutanolyticus TaxID=1499308 RepID=UPI0011AE46F6|nr:hypothetical protein [Paracoccus mutanolyticus]